MKNLLNISLLLFAVTIVGTSFSQDVKKKQEPVKKHKYDAAKNKPLKKGIVKTHEVRKKVVEKK